MRSERGIFKGRIDWAFIAAIVGLVAVGSVAILSAASPLPHYSQIIQRHFLALGLGTGLFLFALGFNYQVYQDQAKTLYVLTLILMVMVLFLGDVQRGTRGWIHLGFFSFQPSEIARTMTILVLANYLDRGPKHNTLRYALGACAIAAPIIGLILLEPDFSSTLPFFPALLGMLYFAGVGLALLLAMVGCGVLMLGMLQVWTLLSVRPELTAGSRFLSYVAELRNFDLPLLLTVVGIFVAAYLLWKVVTAFRVPAPAPYFLTAAAIVTLALCSAAVFDHQIKGYQRDRFVAFLVPESDPKGAAYNVQQAQIAIGSGGLWGKGFFSGTQSQLGFLPERHTDFIYAVIGEEMGFIGGMSVLVLYLLLLWRIVQTARLARDRYGYLVCSGIAVVFGFHLMLNVGMCLGLVPVAGVPLPLVSYGGSSLAVTLFTLGIVANVYSKHYAFY